MCPQGDVSVVDPIKSKGMGFGLQDRTPGISQPVGFVISEVNLDSLILFLDGLEPCTVVGKGWVICECRCMLVSNTFGVSDGNTILLIEIPLVWVDMCARYFPHSVPHLHTCIFCL